MPSAGTLSLIKEQEVPPFGNGGTNHVTVRGQLPSCLFLTVFFS
jgi:hypothetical protein